MAKAAETGEITAQSSALPTAKVEFLPVAEAAVAEAVVALGLEVMAVVETVLSILPTIPEMQAQQTPAEAEAAVLEEAWALAVQAATAALVLF